MGNEECQRKIAFVIYNGCHNMLHRTPYLQENEEYQWKTIGTNTSTFSFYICCEHQTFHIITRKILVVIMN